MGRLIYRDEVSGYEYISDKGIKYSLYELTSLDGESTSDMCCIMNDQYCEIDEAVYKNGKVYPFSYMLVGWFYGAKFVTDPSCQEEYTDYIEEFIDKYERENPDIVKLILDQIDKEKENELFHSIC